MLNACKNARKTCRERERKRDRQTEREREREQFNISQLQCRGAKKEDVYKKFVEKEAKYHKKCYTQYDHNHFHQVPSPPIEKSSESFGPRFSKLFKHVSLLLRGMVCFICNKPDINLSVAGVMHVSKTAADKQQAKETTEQTKTVAIALGRKPIFVQLSRGDIVSNELNYQKLTNNFSSLTHHSEYFTA